MLTSAAISATAAPAVNTPGEQRGGIKGRILTAKGEPLAGGTVYFFNTKIGPPPDHERYWRVPDYKRQLDGDGGFSMSLPEGSYCVGATRRISGGTIGPPQDGDYYFISQDGNGLPMVYELKGPEVLDLGTLSGGGPFQRGTVGYGKGVTSIAGVVVDREGRPVSGAMVLAFTSAERGIRPLFISEPSGNDGAFVIRVHDSGSYFLKVRSMYGGGPPGKGEMVGMYGQRGPEAVKVDKGEHLTGITIRASGFQGKGPQQGGKPMQLK